MFISEASFIQELAGCIFVASQGTVKQGRSGEFLCKIFQQRHSDTVELAFIAVATPGIGQMRQHIGNAFADAFAFFELINQALGAAG
jgi:hypothetical protein